MKTGQSTKLWSLSSDPNEYERNLNLLSGRLKNSLTPEGINQQTLRAGLSKLSVKDLVEVIDDGSDIRKPYSKLLPHLTKVKSLEKIDGKCLLLDIQAKKRFKNWLDFRNLFATKQKPSYSEVRFSCMSI